MGAFNFIREILLKNFPHILHRKSLQKFIHFQRRGKFYKRNPFNFFFEKNEPRNYASKIPSRTVKLEIIFSKNHHSSVILKIVENFSNFMTKLNPQEFWRKL